MGTTAGLSLGNSVLTLSGIFFVLLAVAAALLAARYLRDETAEKSAWIASNYMGALGTLFAILTAFMINTEYSSYRQAQITVGEEVSAASELATATASLPASDTDRIQERLTDYLDALAEGEWQALGDNRPSDSPAAGALRALQQEVYSQASRDYVPDAVAGTLQDAVNRMATARRERVVIASHEMPIVLFGLAVIAGVGLIINSMVVANRSGRRYAFLASIIVLVVALDVGAIVIINAPFQGGLQVSTDPITALSLEIKSGQYTTWVSR